MIVLFSLGWVCTALPHGGDFGPVDQDPQEAAERACDLAGSCDRRLPTPETLPPRSDSGGGGGGGGSVLQLFFWLMVMAAVSLLILVIVRAVIARRDLPDNDDVDTDSTEIEKPMTRIIDRTREPDVWRDEADRLATLGRFREAMRCRYRGLVGDLARHGLLDEIPGRTTGEERRQLADSETPGRPQFDDATYLFDDAWYGELPISSELYDEFVELEHSVLDATGAGRRARR